ncbi:MAG: GNAT family N-acetyltransferase [Acidimicrobiia bacterium]
MIESARTASSADLPRIVELAGWLRQELVTMKGGALWLRREAWPEPLSDAYARLVASLDASVVVGTIDDVVVGYGVVVVETLRSGEHLGVVTDLFVEPGARAVGVGECIATSLLAFCTEHECMGVDALALPGHRDAKNFFERNGFTARALTMHRSLLP